MTRILNQREIPLPLRLVRLYGQNSPLHRGKRWAYKRALRSWPLPEREAIVKDRMGHSFKIDLRDRIYLDLFFQGLYEPEVSWLLAKIVGPGEVVVDAGANFGWFTVLLADLVGPTGVVHAFEPVKDTFEGLTRNLELNGDPKHVTCVRAALGDSDGKSEIFSFFNLGPAYSSLRDLGHEDYRTEPIQLRSLDSYLDEMEISDVALLKIDVEGSELAVLKGAERALSKPKGPTILFEINSSTSLAFGYSTQELLDYVTSKGYSLFRNKRRRLQRVFGAQECRHGDMILARK